MKHFDIIILGAGASGCICALTASKTGKSILIIDKMTKAGKKLMATGNGRCNLTNLNMYPSEKYFNRNISCFLNRFNEVQTILFFDKLGLMTYADEEGRVYPFSNSAKSVIDVINNGLSKNKNISISLENEILNTEKQNDIFVVSTSKGEFSCNQLVVASGGKCAEGILKNFGLKTKEFTPSLVALKTQSTRNLDGVRISNAKLQAICENEKFCETGEVLFKDSGVSGIVAFNASTIFARKNNFNGEINIDLMPDVSHDKLKQILLKRKELKVKISNFFDGMFVSQVGFCILNLTKIENEERLCCTLTEKEIEQFAKHIKNFAFKVKGHYENNQVHSGGVLIEELTENLESQKIKNLFFCGEVCDVDGKCGGYNLQWAWTSGYIVGESL